MVNVIKPPYKSIEAKTDTGKVETISEGFKIRFITEDDGEVKKGVVVGFKGTKSDKVKIQFIPIGKSHEETWAITDIVEGSLKLIEDNEEEEENEEE